MLNDKNKQGKLIEHFLISATKPVEKTCQWLEAKTNLQSSLDRNFVYFIFTRTDNWSKLQLKEVASIQEIKEATLNIGTLIRSMND